MTVKVYRLGVCAGPDDGEGEDNDEWFSSLEKAKRRRRELIAQDPYLDGGHRTGQDYGIHRVWLVELPPRELLIRCLTGRAYVSRAEEVVPDYEGKPRKTVECQYCREVVKANTAHPDTSASGLNTGGWVCQDC
jgi:hypothetical protein